MAGKLDKFAFEALASNLKIWKDDNHASDMNTSEDYDNPVRNGIVTTAEDYLYSTASDYRKKARTWAYRNYQLKHALQRQFS